MKRQVIVIASLALFLLGLPSAAAGQVVPDVTGAPPVSPPAGQPADGRMSIGLSGGLTYRGGRYLAAGQTIRVTGTVKPFVEGQEAVVELYRGRKLVKRVSVPIEKGRKGDGAFSVRLAARRSGGHKVRARHEATAQQQRFSAPSRSFTTMSARAGRGSSGLRVRLLQRGLAVLGFATPQSGRFDNGTARAVLAFRKTNRMGRRSTATRSVFSKLLRGQGAFKLKYPRAGKHVEFDWSRQVLVLASKGRAQRVYHASSGKPSTPTVFGSFRFYRRQPGTNSHGMVHSSYFIRGYAIHGYKSVPNHPASHGCIRVPIPNALSIYRWIRTGERIFVYR
jgi:lipoprotein-anchoring transpeptidase ErfK/SrfK